MPVGSPCCDRCGCTSCWPSASHGRYGFQSPWALWHLPLYGIADGQQRTPLTIFLLSVVARSLIYTWLWLVPGGSLLIAVLLHNTTNVASVLLAEEARGDVGPHIVATALTVVLAAVAGTHLKRASHGYRSPLAGRESDV